MIEKLKEREFLLTLLIAGVIVADAAFKWGLDIQHMLGLVGASGSFAVSRGLAKQGAQKALPALEAAKEVAEKLAESDDSESD